MYGFLKMKEPFVMFIATRKKTDEELIDLIKSVLVLRDKILERKKRGRK